MRNIEELRYSHRGKDLSTEEKVVKDRYDQYYEVEQVALTHDNITTIVDKLNEMIRIINNIMEEDNAPVNT